MSKHLPTLALSDHEVKERKKSYKGERDPWIVDWLHPDAPHAE